MTRPYPWRRFWLPVSETPQYDEVGCLADPESPFAALRPPRAEQAEELDDAPCLFLLGQPGVGKSHEIERLCAFGVDGPDRRCRLDLRDYSNEEQVDRELQTIRESTAGPQPTPTVHLFLDSLDECPYQRPLLRVLRGQMLREPWPGSLRLRVACRTSDWPSSWRDGLCDAFGQRGVSAWQLQPLRRRDIVVALRSEGLPEELLDEIHRLDAVPLAIIPLTLDLLLKTYRSRGSLPRSTAELYEEGCRVLCQENSESRRERGQVPEASPEQLMALAARIAAVTTFTGRHTIRTDADRGDLAPGEIAVRSLCTLASERAAGSGFSVDERMARQTLGTALFHSRGPDRIGWAHQTYREFLAAWYLRHQGLPVERIPALLDHGGTSGRRVAPQLYGVASWCVSLMPALAARLMDEDALAVLHADTQQLSDETRAALTRRLLALYDARAINEPAFDTREPFERLRHPGLAEELRPWLLDRTRGIMARRAAVHIVRSCQVSDLYDVLAELALDPGEDMGVRLPAAGTVAVCADSTARQRLRPLAIGLGAEDPRDNLKGCGLAALWPDLVGTSELFGWMTPPQNPRHSGAYEEFMRGKLLPELQPADIPRALEWVAQVPAHTDPYHDIDDLQKGILRLGWQHATQPGVGEPLARAVLARLGAHKSLGFSRRVGGTPGEVGDADARARALLSELVSILSEGNASAGALLWGTDLVQARDAVWIIEQIKGEPDTERRRRWMEFIVLGTGSQCDATVALLRATAEEVPELAQRFAGLRSLSDPLDESAARGALAGPPIPPNKEQALTSAAEAQRVELQVLLDDLEAGDLSAWWKLNHVMLRAHPACQHVNVASTALARTAVWASAEPALHARLLVAAESYVLGFSVQTSELLEAFGDGRFHEPGWAGYRALRLLHREWPDRLSSLPPNTWGAWAAAVVVCSQMGDLDDPEPELLRTAYRQARSVVLEVLSKLTDDQDRQYGHLSTVDTSEVLWDSAIEGLWVAKLQSEALQAASEVQVLEALLRQRSQTGQQIAEHRICRFVEDECADRDRALMAARLLMVHAPGDTWQTIWSLLQSRPEAGREVIQGAAQGTGLSGELLGRQLSERAVAQLYLWVVEQFPQADHAHGSASGFLTPEASVGMWRHGLLQSLLSRGTRAACTELHILAERLPQFPWMQSLVVEAEQMARAKEWMPLTPQEVLALTADPRKRVVRDADDLFDLVVEALARWEEELRGADLMLRWLWESPAKPAVKGWRPKDEGAFCDLASQYLKRELQDKRIVVNCEPQIRRIGLSHQELDIRVEAPIPGHEQTVQVIIEGKGCWNRELTSAMQTQLAERYLRENACHHGIYLVGWFNCERWSHDDNRWRDRPRCEIDDLRSALHEQAETLPASGLRILAVVVDVSCPDQL